MWKQWQKLHSQISWKSPQFIKANMLTKVSGYARLTCKMTLNCNENLTNQLRNPGGDLTKEVC